MTSQVAADRSSGKFAWPTWIFYSGSAAASHSATLQEDSRCNGRWTEINMLCGGRTGYDGGGLVVVSALMPSFL